MSVIGIDFGNESCYVAVAKAGGIETIANDYSLRATPSCVAFAGRNRVLGVAAKNQQVTNMNNTIGGFKRLLGRKYNDPHVQNELRKIPYKVEPRPDGGIGIRVNYQDEECVFSPEQITAMLFTKLKDDSFKELKAQINDCVITVPSYFTNAERQALLDAAGICGLNVLRLMNETTATALSYGFYKQDLPAPEEKARNVIFVDCGHSALQVSACAFHKGKLKMLASCADQVGGRDFDYALAEHFSNEFQTKYKIDPRTNKRAYLRLLTEAEKLKKQMSANSTKLPLNIECFMNEIDVHSTIQRGDMETMCAGSLQRIEATMKKLLKDSNLALEDIHSVEIVGGSSRIPAIKQLIEQIFGKTASTTLNQDEAVSRGAALQCAILSPAVRVREFTCSDVQAYPVLISWEDGTQRNEMKVFEQYHTAPFSRLLTVHRREPMTINVHYEPNSVPYPDTFIGSFHIKDIKPNANGDPQEVKIKVRINQNGIVLVSSATMVEKRESEEPVTPPATANGEQPAQTNSPQGEESPKTGEPMDIQEGSDDEQSRNDTTKSDNDNSGGGGSWTQRVSRWFTSSDKKKKVTTKSIDLTIDGKTHGFVSNDLSKYHELEMKMIANDRQEKERVDARNALEEFVYEVRGKIQEDGELSAYVEQDEASKICLQLEDIENWLYEDGENCERTVYKDKLLALHKQTEPIRVRCEEYNGHEQAFTELGHTIQLTYKAVEQIRAKDPKYDHLTETEILNITEAAQKAQKWYEEARSKLVNVRKTQDPPVKVADIRHENQTLATCTNSVLNRPKPKPPTPPADNNKDQQQNGGDQAKDQQQADQSTEAPKDFTEDKMDVE
ncbi:heat shock 70 kDa protein 4 isoform X1 [Aedes albopictus]|uniref:Heat shock 70 kDa protein 4 n=1 Tax=Aedes albopictus TaxID=7160 RepID=A0ABM1XTM7_AEDAL|nr:heat shock 70 kDa protein 4-like isoform X1 [Aedes albopictus]XP_029731188.1 LOW QUALITY PROTEIN: heat shock 70 kDa protein 4 [Aedes albopictus]